MAAMITDTMELIRSLPPMQRRALGDYCLWQSEDRSWLQDDRRMLKALSGACNSVDPFPQWDALVANLVEMNRRLAGISPARYEALAEATEAWIRDRSPERLLAMVALLSR